MKHTGCASQFDAIEINGVNQFRSAPGKTRSHFGTLVRFLFRCFIKNIIYIINYKLFMGYEKKKFDNVVTKYVYNV